MSEPNWGETRKYWEKHNEKVARAKAAAERRRVKALLRRAKRPVKPKDTPDGA